MTMVTFRAPEPPPQDQDEEILAPNQEVFEGPQTMEESAAAVDQESLPDTSTSRFTWKIESISKQSGGKLHSDVFVVGGYSWRVLVFPTGNSVNHLSMYLDVADAKSLPNGWSRSAQFGLAVINQLDSKHSLRKEATHAFNSRESDWGFTSFMPLMELYDPSKGYIVNDQCIIEAEIAVHRMRDDWSYDSKKETCYVGLENQGATCYMNSLLQTLYHINYFRKAVYHMPTADTPPGSITLALQSLFYKLQHGDSSISTKELTKSFGWNTYDSFMQHDVQELNRVLCEKLEDKMKGTIVDGTIQKLFEGHHMNYIECINEDYKSTRKESFYDLALDVKGCSDVYASFDKYVAVEMLEGDNKYQSEKHGLQDAKKGMLFTDLPPVLQLQLKRFEYDFMRDTMVKINDHYEFPLQLDLDRDNRKYLSPEADKSVRNLYTLHSVLVHSGGVNGGHYYAFIRPTLSNQWYKFDDERVTKADMQQALEEQYGGEEELTHANTGLDTNPLRFTKYSNAYMLVYVRESDKDNIICDLDETDISEHLKTMLRKKNEVRENKKKEKAEAHMFTTLKVARDIDFAEQVGRHVIFDLADFEKIRSFRVSKEFTFNQVKEELSKEFGIPAHSQRFWLWAKRQNNTYRPTRPLTQQEETNTVGHLKDAIRSQDPELRLYLEIVQENHLSLTLKTEDDILLFFKLYDPDKEELRYVGSLYLKASSKPSDIVQKLNAIAGFQPDEDIALYEEVKFEPCVMCEPVDADISFSSSQLVDGDILCYQKRSSLDRMDQHRHPNVPSFFEYIHNRQGVVHFRLLDKPKEDDFSLELKTLTTVAAAGAMAKVGPDGHISKKLKLQNGEEGQRGRRRLVIGDLQDELLGEIVSRLPLKEGARTQLLSPQWRTIWRHAPLNLDSYDLGPGVFDVGALRVEYILSLHSGPGRRFTLRASGMDCRPTAARVNSWLSSPALKNLQQLQLRFEQQRLTPSERLPDGEVMEMEAIPEAFFRFSTSLQIADIVSYRFPDPACAAFTNMKYLTLEHVFISEMTFQSLIKSSVLESLLLCCIMGFTTIHISSKTIRCIGFRVGPRLKTHLAAVPANRIAIKDCPLLKRLLILDMYNPVSASIEGAPNLDVIGYISDGSRSTDDVASFLALKGFLTIKRLEIESLLSGVSSVRILAIHMGVLDVGKIIAMLKCFPCLERLYVQCASSGSNFWQTKHKDFGINMSLKIVVLNDYKGTQGQVRAGKFFLQKAGSLQLLLLGVASHNYTQEFYNKQLKALQYEHHVSSIASVSFRSHFYGCFRYDNKFRSAHEIDFLDPFAGT